MKQAALFRRIRLFCYAAPCSLFLAAVLTIASLTGCQTTPSTEDLDISSITNMPTESIILHGGDTIQITFPGAPNLNAQRTIRPDGKIDMQLVGEVTAAGLTPKELEKKLIDLYSDKILEKEINVVVLTSSFPVFVTGAVIRPGKINSDRPLTALDAVMEAGGFDQTRANMKAVMIIRNVNGRMEHHKIDLNAVLKGTSPKAFYLKPSDIVYVPERFQIL